MDDLEEASALQLTCKICLRTKPFMVNLLFPPCEVDVAIQRTECINQMGLIPQSHQSVYQGFPNSGHKVLFLVEPDAKWSMENKPPSESKVEVVPSSPPQLNRLASMVRPIQFS